MEGGKTKEQERRRRGGERESLTRGSAPSAPSAAPAPPPQPSRRPPRGHSPCGKKRCRRRSLNQGMSSAALCVLGDTGGPSPGARWCLTPPSTGRGPRAHLGPKSRAEGAHEKVEKRKRGRENGRWRVRICARGPAVAQPRATIREPRPSSRLTRDPAMSGRTERGRERQR